MISEKEAFELVKKFHECDPDVLRVVDHFKNLHYSVVESWVCDTLTANVFRYIFQKGKTDKEIVAELQKMTGGRHW